MLLQLRVRRSSSIKRTSESTSADVHYPRSWRWSFAHVARPSIQIPAMAMWPARQVAKLIGLERFHHPASRASRGGPTPTNTHQGLETREAVRIIISCCVMQSQVTSSPARGLQQPPQPTTRGFPGPEDFRCPGAIQGPVQGRMGITT